MKKIIFLFFLLAQRCVSAQSPAIIPMPDEVLLQNGMCKLSDSTELIYLEPATKNAYQVMQNWMSKFDRNNRFSVLAKSSSLFTPYVKLEKVKSEVNSYEIKVEKEGVLIKASQESVIPALATLTQLFLQYRSAKGYEIPCMIIRDAPLYKWRGMHLDVCRHFFNKDFVKKYIDLMAFYKMNRFHWHLTEDQGWRIEIKKYPKLTSVGAWRNGSMIGPYSDHKFDTIRYGGFYTQEEIKEVVKYASERGVTVVPEIEMPGHALAALASYPELSCTGGPFSVERGWGVFDDVYCPKEETFLFLENVLSEVMDLFPGEYIHIGGDECPKIRWKNCSHCQDLMKREGLKDEHELQSYFIRRIDKFVTSKGKKIIGWDEILEGGLAPNAAVMSWRGTIGGIAAAEMHHDVIMTPGEFCYFDHYQGYPDREPLAIGGYTTLQKVYSFDPLPQELKPEDKKYILGAQGNVWTEYMTSEAQVEYMVFPRIAALSEVLWTNVSRRNESDFMKRIISHTEYWQRYPVRYSISGFDVQISTLQKNHELYLVLQAPEVGKIQYELGPVYERNTNKLLQEKWYDLPVKITESSLVLAWLKTENGKMFRRVDQKIFVGKSTAKKVSVLSPLASGYEKSDAQLLVNGLRGGISRRNDEWLSWENHDAVVEIDLLKQDTISTISVGYLTDPKQSIFSADLIIVETSVDGKNYTTMTVEQKNEMELLKRDIVFRIRPLMTRYVRITLPTMYGRKNGADNYRIYLDEIIIN